VQLLVTADRHLWGFGNNDYGQQSASNFSSSRAPQEITFFKTRSVKQACCGNYNSCVLTMEGEVCVVIIPYTVCASLYTSFHVCIAER